MTTTITQTTTDGQLETLELSPWMAEVMAGYRREYLAHETRALASLERLVRELAQAQRPANVGPFQVAKLEAIANLLEAAVGELPAAA